MARPPVKNVAASVRDRLANLARERKQPFELLLTRYVLERLLFRLSQTPHAERFLLKGAMLLTTWFDTPFRPTRDLDLLGHGDPDPDPDEMIGVFTEVPTGQLAIGRRFCCKTTSALPASRRDQRRETLFLVFRQISATGAPSLPCLRMNAFWASENFEAFIVFRSSQPGDLAAKTLAKNGPVFRSQITSP